MSHDPHHEAKVDLEYHRKWASNIGLALTYLVCNPEIVPAESDRKMLGQLCSEIEEHLNAIEGERLLLFEDVETRPAALEAAA